MGRYSLLAFPPDAYPSLNWSGICAVPTDDVVATGEKNCYDYIVRLRTFPSYTETIGQGYVAQRPPATCENDLHRTMHGGGCRYSR